MKFFTVIPHSKPSATCLVWFFSLKSEPIFPVNIIAPSLIILASLSWDISPSITFEPAICPNFETLNIFCTSAVPSEISLVSGSSSPDNLFSMYSIAS